MFSYNILYIDTNKPIARTRSMWQNKDNLVCQENVCSQQVLDLEDIHINHL